MKVASADDIVLNYMWSESSLNDFNRMKTKMLLRQVRWEPEGDDGCREDISHAPRHQKPFHSSSQRPHCQTTMVSSFPDAWALLQRHILQQKMPLMGLRHIFIVINRHFNLRLIVYRSR